MNQFKKLIVWQKSMLLAKIVFTLTDKLPVKEKFGLIEEITETMNLIHEIQKMLNSLQRKLNPILSTKY